MRLAKLTAPEQGTPESAVSVEAQTLNLNAAEVTGLGYAGVGSIYLAVVTLSLLVPVPWDTAFTIGFTGFVSLFSWVGWFWLRAHPIAPNQAHPALFILISIMAIHTGAMLYYIGDPIHSGNQMLAFLAAAFFIAARGWFYCAITIIFCCWLPAAMVGLQDVQQGSGWNQWSRMLLVSMALAITFFEARRRTVLRTYQLKREAETALAEVQDANASRLAMQHMMQEAQRREALGVLAGGIAHDFNNLLGVITGNLELLMMGAKANGRFASESEAGEMMEEMDRACDRAIELTQQMLVYAGRSKPKIGRIQLGERIRSTARLISSSTPANVKLELIGDESGPEVRVDSTQLDQLIINLIQNAVEACEPRGGVVRLNWEADRLTGERLAKFHFSSPAAEGMYAVVEVSDNGEGMDDETRRKMFEPFYSTKANGNGLGLAVANGILVSHAAGVVVHSTPGQGTLLRLAMPVSPALDCEETVAC